MQGKFRIEDRGYKTPCHIFTGGRLNDSGYGIAWCRVRKREFRAHRLSYEMSVGRIPDGAVIDHLCSNRDCVNPEHLEPVTNTENTRRGMSTKLTETKVKDIKLSSLSAKELAAKFEVSPGTIRDIRSGRRWAEV